MRAPPARGYLQKLDVCYRWGVRWLVGGLLMVAACSEPICEDEGPIARVGAPQNGDSHRVPPVEITSPVDLVPVPTYPGYFSLHFSSYPALTAGFSLSEPLRARAAFAQLWYDPNQWTQRARLVLTSTVDQSLILAVWSMHGPTPIENPVRVSWKPGGCLKATDFGPAHGLALVATAADGSSIEVEARHAAELDGYVIINGDSFALDDPSACCDFPTVRNNGAILRAGR